MTSKDIFNDVFPQDKQIGGNHYKSFQIQPYEFISKNDLSFFQGNVIKYVCRYKNKNGIEDLEKIKHYCELEIKKLKDTNDNKRKKVDNGMVILDLLMISTKKDGMKSLVKKILQKN